MGLRRAALLAAGLTFEPAPFAGEPRKRSRLHGTTKDMSETAPLEDFVALYRRAFAEHKLRALWSVREQAHPTVEDALLIVPNLRIEGDLNARRLAEQIERACRAAV